MPASAIDCLEDVGQRFNVTRERIRQIEAKALLELGHPSRSPFLQRLCQQEHNAID